MKKGIIILTYYNSVQVNYHVVQRPLTKLQASGGNTGRRTTFTHRLKNLVPMTARVMACSTIIGWWKFQVVEEDHQSEDSGDRHNKMGEILRALLNGFEKFAREILEEFRQETKRILTNL